MGLLLLLLQASCCHKELKLAGPAAVAQAWLHLQLAVTRPAAVTCVSGGAGLCLGRQLGSGPQLLAAARGCV
jgi:hypothetical protein